MHCLCSAKAVANHFLELAWSDGTTLNPMQIQKLVYIAHGWHLAITEKPLIHESVEAWTYGPVIPDPTEVKAILGRVWEVYKRFSAVHLSNMTHMEGTPWDQTWKKNDGKRSVSIDDSLIREHFRELGEKNVNRKVQA